MVSTRDEWENMTPDQKADRLNDDLNALRREMIGLHERIDRVIKDINRRFEEVAKEFENYEKKPSSATTTAVIQSTPQPLDEDKTGAAE